MNAVKIPLFRRRRFLARAALATALLTLLGMVAFQFALRLVPLPTSLFLAPAAEVQLLDRNGQSLRNLRPRESPFGRPLPEHQVPSAFVHATLAAEDRLFWKHCGINWRGIARAAWQNLRHGRVVSGGSTITQQLIKLAQPRPRTLRTKLIEALQAMRLEQVWSKSRILTEYLNRLDYGNLNRGCVAAAQFYFAKPPADLSPAECALLAALPQAPTRLNPRLSLEPARKRQRWILGQMHRAGWLTPGEYARALNEPLRLVSTARTFEAPHFVDFILAQTGALGQAPGIIKTTLDLELNRYAETVLRRQLSLLPGRQEGNGAVVILDNRTREVLVLVGSEDYSSAQAGQVNGAWARRSAGSTLKPFTYLLALERGATAASIVADVPTEFATTTGLFVPANYDRHCYGPVRYRNALANSLNIPAIKVLASIGGPAPLLGHLRNCGLTTLTRSAEDYGLGLTLGNAEVRLLELANAYACLATLGEFKPFEWLLPTQPRSSGKARRVADSSVAYLIADILSDNAARSLAFGPQSPLRFDFPVACKTGTSSDFRDNWAFGYTPEFTVGVWVGNFDGAPMKNISGVSGAAPILHDLFVHLQTIYGTTWYPVPQNIIECQIHPLTGKRVGSATSHAVTEIFVESNLPPFESDLDYKPSGRRIVLDPEYRDWFASADNWLTDQAVLKPDPAAPRFRFPISGTTFLLDSAQSGLEQQMVLQIDSNEVVECGSDSLQITRKNGRWSAPLKPGHHQIWARDPSSGCATQTQIEVIVR